MFERAKAINELRKIQSALSKETVEVESGNGAVTVKMNGEQKIQKITLNETLIREAEIDKVEKWIESALTQAITRSQQMAAEKMKAISGDLGLPGF